MSYSPNRAVAALGRPRAPQKRVHARDRFPATERLGNVIVGAQVQPEHDIFFLPFRREHQDGHFQAAFPHRAADFVAVHAWQHNVQQNQLGFAIQREIQARRAILGRQNLKSLSLKRIFEPAQQGRLVFHDQNPVAHATASFSNSSSSVRHGRQARNVLPAPGRLPFSAKFPVC